MEIKTAGSQIARGPARRVFISLARCLSLVWVAPALVYNLDWSAGATWYHNVGAGFTILAAALFFHVALEVRRVVPTIFLLVVAVFLAYTNTKSAIRNLSLASEGASEAKLAQIGSASHLASQRSRLETRLAAQVKAAGDAAVGTLEAEVESLKASDPRLWRASQQCEVPKGSETGPFCAKVAQAKGKVLAATLRDQLQTELDRLPMPTMVVADQKTVVADPYVANIVTLGKLFGFAWDERAVRAEEALSRALGFELVATVGPGAHLMAINLIVVGGAAAAGMAQRLRNLAKGRKRKKVPTPVPQNTQANDADVIDKWIADDLEDGTGFMPSKELREMCQAWCSTHAVDMPNEKELWQRVKARGWKHDPNNGRPRYLGVKRRAKASPGLRVVANNG